MLLAVLAIVFGLAALMPVAVRIAGRNAGYLGAAVLTGLAVWLGSHAGMVLDGQPLEATRTWLPSAGLDLTLRLDGLGLLFASIVLGIGALVLAYSARYFAVAGTSTARYLTLLTFFAGAMLGLVLADDVVLLFVFWELTSVTSYFLIGGLGEGRQGATRAFITTAIGGLALLAGVILIALAAGTSSLSTILADPAVVRDAGTAPAAIVLLLLAAATKSAQVPFHFWLPGAMVAPTPVSTYLHAATMVKAGIYLVFRFTPLFGGEALWQIPLVLVGLGTALFAAVVAVKQTDLKALLAYSTVSQLGLLTGLIGIGTPAALGAAAIHTLAHALYKATLFMTVGVVEHETGTRDLRALGGLRRTLPLTAAAGGLAAASMAGLPPLLGFVSKEEAFAAFIEAGGPGWLAPVATTLAVLASIGTVAYSARYYLGTFEGTVRTPAHAAPRAFAAPALVAAVVGAGLGLMVWVLDPVANGVALDTTGADPHLHLALWHGLALPLLLSAIVVGVGLALVLLRTRVERWQSRVRLPLSGAAVYDRAYDGVLRLGALVGVPARSNTPARYVLPILAVLIGVGVTVGFDVDRSGLGPPAAWMPADWAVIVLLAGCIAGVIQAGSRLGAIATLGLAGFTVAGWFVLIGAPDLALTQLLVETLTVAVVVLVFRRLPATFTKRERSRKLGSALVAVAIGGLAGAATYLFTGRRDLSPVGERFLAEGEGLTGGGNVVNTILVDFRALDTLGEITVLGVAAVAVVALIRLSEHRAVPRPPRSFGGDGHRDAPPGWSEDHQDVWAGIGVIDSPILRSATNGLAPAMIVASLWLLVRGHDAVGGGFIGGLTAGSAVVLLYLSRGHQRIWQSRLLQTLPLVGAGLLIALAYGVGGLVLDGALLAGTDVTLPFGLHVAASLVFDIGVYLVVVGIVVAAIRHLGQGIPEEPPDPDRMATNDPGGDPAASGSPSAPGSPGTLPGAAPRRSAQVPR